MRFSPVSLTVVLLPSLPSDQGGSIDDTYLGIAIGMQIGTDLQAYSAPRRISWQKVSDGEKLTCATTIRQP